MAGVTWDTGEQNTAISGLEYQVLLMKDAKRKMLPEIDSLRHGWDTKASTVTIDKFEKFLDNDFEEFTKLFDITIDKLKRVREISLGMDQLQ